MIFSLKRLKTHCTKIGRLWLSRLWFTSLLRWSRPVREPHMHKCEFLCFNRGPPFFTEIKGIYVIKCNRQLLSCDRTFRILNNEKRRVVDCQSQRISIWARGELFRESTVPKLLSKTEIWSGLFVMIRLQFQRWQEKKELKKPSVRKINRCVRVKRNSHKLCSDILDWRRSFRDHLLRASCVWHLIIAGYSRKVTGVHPVSSRFQCEKRPTTFSHWPLPGSLAPFRTHSTTLFCAATINKPLLFSENRIRCCVISTREV